MVIYFRNDCVGSPFSIQILEIFEGDGCVNGKVSLIVWEKRLERGKQRDETNKLRTKSP